MLKDEVVQSSIESAYAEVVTETEEEVRKTGIDVIGDTPWGTHFCQFYETKEDLIDVLVPYFKAGLENNEFCMWVTSEPLSEEETKEAMRRAVRDFDRYFKRGQIEIVPHTEWYLKEGAFNLKRVLNAWVDKLNQALAKGYDGIRVTGNTGGLEKRDWKNFADYEEEVNSVIGKYRMIAICTYPLDKCGASEVIDVVRNHQFALIKRRGGWELIESSEVRRVEEALRRSEAKFRNIFESANDGMIYLDSSGRILDVNTKAVQFFGGSKEELLGKHFTRLGIFSSGDIPELENTFANILAGKKSTITISIKNKKGQEIPLECSASLMKTDDRLTAMVIARDVTERKEAEEEIKKIAEEWSRTFDAISDLVFILDKDFRFVRVNKALCDFLKRETKELIGKRCYEVLHGTDKPWLNCPCKRMKVTKKAETTEINDPNTGLSLLATVSPLFDENGEHVGCVHVAKDITERKRTEEALRESEERFRNLFENAGDGILTFDLRGRITNANEKIEEISGLSREEIVGRHITHFARLGIVNFKDIPWLLKAFAKRLRGEPIRVYEVRIKDMKGQEKFIEFRGNLIKQGGKPVGVVEIIRDVTEEKKAEEKLRFLKKFNEDIVNSIGDTLLVIDHKNYTIITANEAASKQLKLRKEDLIGKTCYEATHHRSTPCKPPHHICPIQETLRTGKPVTVEHTHFDKDNNEIIVEVSARPVRDNEGRIVHFVHLARDITEKKKAEEKIRESEERYRVLVESAADAIFTLNEAGDFLSANQEAAKAMGKTPEEMIGKNMYDLFPKNIAEFQMGNVKAVFKTGNPILADETMTQTKFGRRWYSTTLVPVRDSDGKIIYVMGISRDITERKNMEEKLTEYSEHLEELVQKRTEELSESEKRYSVLVEQASDGVVIIQGGKTVFVNRKFSEIVGYRTDELIGLTLDQTLEKLVGREYHQRIKEIYKQRLRGEMVPSTDEAQFITKTGERIPVERSGALINYQGRPAVLYILRDITERKRIDEQRLKLEKLATIGELATMVGHDLRNPLQSIQNAIYYLKSELPCARAHSIPKKAIEMLQVIDDSVDYANKIIRDLQDFSATRKPKLEKTDINATIRETLSQIKTTENVELITELDQLPEIKVDKDMIKRVFINLITNGKQAMRNGGTLRVSTKKAKDFVEISFKDTGIGMPKESMEKLFTPFFTTKAKGMGMGLPICKRFVESHGGSIEVESEEGRGSTFTVKLPIQQVNGGEKT